MISKAAKKGKCQVALSYLLFLMTGIFSTQACVNKEEPLPPTQGEAVRLKYLTTARQVATALTASMQGYEMQEGESFTDEGNYPEIWHIYYYTVNFKQDIDGYVYAWRSVSSQTGMGKETKEEMLNLYSEMEEVPDARLGKAPYENVFALRYRDNQKGDWRYELHIRLAHINNQDNQQISISGSFGPTSNEEHEAIAPEPIDSHAAITAMLNLVEPI